jgi:hypothetical protein
LIGRATFCAAFFDFPREIMRDPADGSIGGWALSALHFPSFRKPPIIEIDPVCPAKHRAG